MNGGNYNKPAVLRRRRSWFYLDNITTSPQIHKAHIIIDDYPGAATILHKHGGYSTVKRSKHGLVGFIIGVIGRSNHTGSNHTRTGAYTTATSEPKEQRDHDRTTRFLGGWTCRHEGWPRRREVHESEKDERGHCQPRQGSKRRAAKVGQVLSPTKIPRDYQQHTILLTDRQTCQSPSGVPHYVVQPYRGCQGGA